MTITKGMQHRKRLCEELDVNVFGIFCNERSIPRKGNLFRIENIFPGSDGNALWTQFTSMRS